MTPKPTSETTEAPAETEAPKVAAPVVETSPTFEPGEKVKHVNGADYLVRYQTPEGVALEGVANLVHPSALTKI